MSVNRLPKSIKRFSREPGSRLVAEQYLFKIYKTPIVDYQGNSRDFTIIQRPDTVSIIPVLDNGKILIANEEQPHWGTAGKVIMSGTREKGESIVDAAKRELMEEAGLIMKDYYHVMTYRMGALEWFFHQVVARVEVKWVEPQLEPGESLTVQDYSLEEIIQMIREEQFIYPPRLLESYMLTDRLDELRDLLAHPDRYQVSWQD
ncbi:NUDIX hydrolase [Candidatus Saccharibacteria bacterium]|nr:NUDIX hydrolase [Candidatus Saccharibacteria bacterium]MCB9834980.1 NUDIX hydrolase [Candidatus Nomurabacteria bacterium]